MPGFSQTDPFDHDGFFRLIAQYIQCILAERRDQAMGQRFANATDQATGQIQFNSLGALRRNELIVRRRELPAVIRMLLPDTKEADRFTW